jgi:carboxymethylenebutenolidase
MPAPSTLELDTPDGRMPVRVFEPPAGPRKGGVLFYMDAFGLRPELDGMCRRYVEAGYVTFLPDLYYRLGSMSFAVPATAHEPVDPAMIAANGATTVEMTIADTGVLLRHVAETPAYGIGHFATVVWAQGTRWGQGRPTRMRSGPLPACMAVGSCGTHPTRPTFTFRTSRARST